MILRLLGVRDAGDIQKERLVLRVLIAGNPGAYLILCADGDPNGLPLSGPSIQSYWMPDFEAAKDDLIVIYTKAGQSKTKQNDSTGRRTFFYYWNCSNAIWGEGTVAALLNVANHTHLTVGAIGDAEEEPQD